MIEMFGYPFMIRALGAGLMVGALASYYGVFIVQRKLSFLGSGLAHAAFGGVALALLLQTEPLYVAIPFTVVVAVAINWVHSHTRLSGDTAIGVFFAVAVALGIIFLSLRDNSSADALSYLFGSILAVSYTDLWIVGVIFLVAIGTLPRLWGRWAYATFDEEIATADGLKTGKDDLFLTILIAITVVVSIKVVGVLLIAGFLVIPAASARLLAPSFLLMTVYAIGIGVGSALIGLVISYELDLPSGAAIVLSQAFIFAVALTVSRVRS